MNEFRWMGADLTLVLALVAAVNALDTQTPVVRVLKLDGVPRIARIRVLTHRQQIHLAATLLPPYPGHLRETASLKSVSAQLEILVESEYHRDRLICVIVYLAKLLVCEGANAPGNYPLG